MVPVITSYQRSPFDYTSVVQIIVVFSTGEDISPATLAHVINAYAVHEKIPKQIVLGIPGHVMLPDTGATMYLLLCLHSWTQACSQLGSTHSSLTPKHPTSGKRCRRMGDWNRLSQKIVLDGSSVAYVVIESTSVMTHQVQIQLILIYRLHDVLLSDLIDYRSTECQIRPTNGQVNNVWGS